jgi:hypothetical protein
VGYVDVYRNGVMLGSADYTATSGTTIVLASGATAGDLVEVISFYVSSVLNAIPGTAGSVGTTYLANASVTNDKLSLAANASNIMTALNASGSAPIYAARAWVNFNGTGTPAISASGNVSSITDDGIGKFRLNLITALPDVNFSIAGSASLRDVSDDGNSGVVAIRRLSSVAITTSIIPIQTTYYGTNGTLGDFPFTSVMIIR